MPSSLEGADDGTAILEALPAESRTRLLQEARHRVSHGMASAGFLRISTTQLQVFWPRLGCDVCIRQRAWLKGYFSRQDMPWKEKLEHRSQKRHRKTIMLVAMQEIGTVTAPNIIRAKQATQKELWASFRPRRAEAASIMSIIGTRPGPGGQHHEHHWRLVFPFQGKPKHSFFMPVKGVRLVGKMQLQVQSRTI